MSLVSLYYVMLLLVLTSKIQSTHAAHSRRRIVVRSDNSNRYDRSITTFSQDGRLPQVEYGMQASARGGTTLALRLPDCIVVLTGLGKWHRLDHHIWLATAGLSGDARLLAQALRNHAQEHRLAYGEDITTRQLTRVAGSAQHQLTRTGGARPLGCTALLVGIDTDALLSGDNGTTTEGSSDDGKNPDPASERLRLFQTDPGGIVEEVEYAVAGKNRVVLTRELAAILEKRKSKDATSVDKVAVVADLLKKLLHMEASNSHKDEKISTAAVDVWILRPDSRRRGGVHATCYSDVGKESISDIRKHLQR